MTSTCRDLKAQLSDYIDGELDEGLCGELEKHLAGCENCRIVVDTLRKTILLYRNYGAVSLPDRAHERLIHVLRLDTSRVAASSNALEE